MTKTCFLPDGDVKWLPLRPFYARRGQNAAPKHLNSTENSLRYAFNSSNSLRNSH